MGHVHLQETAVKKRSNGMRTDRIHSKTTVRTMSFCVCCQERAEACLHLRESHALAKDVVRKANFYRRCLFERCKVGKCFFVSSGAVPAEASRWIQLCFGQAKWKEATGI